MEQIVVVGGGYGGQAATRALLGRYPSRKILLMEEKQDTGWGSELQRKGVQLWAGTRVTAVDFVNHRVLAVGQNGEQTPIPYHRLLLATGSVAPPLPFSGGSLQGVFGGMDSETLREILTERKTVGVAVGGGGALGAALAEAAVAPGRRVVLVEEAPQLFPEMLDPWLTNGIERVLDRLGITLALGERVVGLEQADGAVSGLVTTRGTYRTQLVIFANKRRPNALLGGGELELGATGGFLVDDHQQTSEPHVYAIGDCATHGNGSRSLFAGGGVKRQAAVAVESLCGEEKKPFWVEETFQYQVGGVRIGGVGLTEALAKKAGYHPLCRDYQLLGKNSPLTLPEVRRKTRMVYDRDSGRLLGAQIVATEGDLGGQLAFFALGIAHKLTREELEVQDLFFSPHYDQPL